MLGHQPAQPASQPPEAFVDDDDLKRVDELREEHRVAELVEEKTSLDTKKEILANIRTAFEKFSAIASSSLLLQRATLAAALKVAPSNPELRTTTLEYVSRIAISDVPKECVTDLLTFCQDTLLSSHEEDGALAQEILSDIFKAYKNSLEELCAPYLQWLVQLFENIPASVEKYIVNYKKVKTDDVIPAIESIKISQDIAMTAFSLFQSYPRKLNAFGPDLVAKMVTSISMPTVPVPPEDNTRAYRLYTDLKTSQVKTLVFLVILSRSQTAKPMVEPHQEAVCSALVSIMKTSPSKNLALRKEILNAFRTLLTSDELNKGLVPKIEELLDMDCLIGTDRAVSESLKQVAFIHLTELLLLVKQEIKVEFIQQVVDLAIDSLMDASAPLTLHVTSVRVLYNIVVDIVFPRRAESGKFREILSSILECMLTKLDSMCVEIPRILSISRDLEVLHKKHKEEKDAQDTKIAVKEDKILTAGKDKEVVVKKEAGMDEMDVDVAEPEAPHDNDRDGAPGAADALDGVSLQCCFKTVQQSPHQSLLKERELLEFRNLAHGLVNTSKTVAYVVIVYHTSRGLKGPVSSHIKPWSSRKSDVRMLCEIMKSALRFISLFERLIPTIQNFDPRDVLREMYSVIMDQNEYINVFGPNVPFIFETAVSNSWYLGFVRNVIEEETAGENRNRTFSNRYAIACILNYLVNEKIGALKDIKSREGAIVLQLFQMCFETLPRIQNNDLQRAPQLAANGVPGVERVVHPYVMAFLKKVTPLLSESPDIVGYMKATRSLFFALAATNKFLDIQTSVGSSGLHVQIIETFLSLMNGPLVASKEMEEMCAEICLLVPARLEHLIPLIPRMMQAAVVALNSGDRSVHIALRVLDVWVESFNPEFIERSMSRVTKPLMTALWSHIKPQSQGQFGNKVASMLGKMGGRGRRWLGENASIDYKEIPEYGMRVILAFPPHTSFLVPLDRCVQLAWTTLSSGTDAHMRKNALRLLQICAETLSRLHLPNNMLPVPSAQATSDQDKTPVPQMKDQKDVEVEGSNELDEKNLKKLEKLLFDPSEPPQIPADLVWPPELGVKTKKQHAAEKKMLETILTAIISSSSVEDDIEGCESRAFAHATCRHFAFLMTAGWSNMAIPPWAPPTSRMVKYDVLQGIPAYVATLKHLQPHILLDAFEKGLEREREKERKATIECMSVFLDTLIDIGRTQQQLASTQIDVVDKDNDAKDNKTERNGTNKMPNVRDKLAREVPYLSIQQDLVTRARHCCYGDTWASKLGGAMALDALSKRMPQSLLTYAAHYIVKALMTVLRSFPDNAVQEIQEVTSVITGIVSRANGLPSSDDVVLTATGAASTTPAPTPSATKDSVKKDEDEADEDDDEEDEPQVTTRRGKRTKRGARGPAASRKKQKREVSKEVNVEEKADDTPDAELSKDPSKVERDTVRLQNDLLQAVMSSKNNDAVRAAATQCLEITSSACGTTIGAMLDQILSRQPASKSLLERRILPLRSIVAQTNYAHSMAFLFRHYPSLNFSDLLCTFVADCCTILEQSDGSIAASTSIRGQQPKQPVIFKLKFSCLEVLVECLTWPQFRDAKDDVKVTKHKWDSTDPRDNDIEDMNVLRSRIIAAFVRSMGSSSAKIVNLSKLGLRLAKEQGVLAKVNLVGSMNPLLADMFSISRLSLDRLNHLHHLLDVVADSFEKDTLGDKFVEHLQAWVDYEEQVAPIISAANASGVPATMEPGTECQLAVSMLDVFHKLPAWAAGFLETRTLDDKSSRPGLVVLTIGLEQCLSSLPGPPNASVCWSPYRDPLVRFLSRYPDNSIDYFVKTTARLSSADYFSLFIDIIGHPSGKVLLERLKERSDTILDVLKADEASDDAQQNCIQLVRTVCNLSPDWLPLDVYQACRTLWESGKFEERTFADLTTVLLNYVRRHESEVDLLLQLPEAFVGHRHCDLTPLKEYLMRDFPRESSEETKQKVLSLWIDAFKIDSVGSADVVKVRFLLCPMIEWMVQRDQSDVLSPDLIESLVTKIFGTVLAEDSESDELFQSEVIQLCVALVRHVPQLLRDHKKLIIQCIWWTLKKDNIAKSYAFLCVAHFFRAYLGNKDDENDINLVLKAFFNMLRMNAHDSATREAVKQAIDYIIPILGEQAEEGGDSDPHSAVDVHDGSKKRLIFPSALKRLLREEGMLSPVMVLVMQMVVRNREAFYSSRLSFIPVILASLNRYGLPNQSTIDSRNLAVDMAVTMYWWDEKAKAEIERGGRATLLTKEMDSSIMNFLLRMTFVSCEVRDRDETGWKKLHAHCLNNLRDAARYRRDCSFKLQFFEKLLHNSVHQQKQQAAAGKSVGPNPVLLTGLRICTLFMEHQPSNFVQCCHQQLAIMIEPSIYNKNLSTIEPLSTTMRHFYAAYPDNLAAADPSTLNTPELVAVAGIQKQFLKTLAKYLTHIAEVEQFNADVFWFACNCVRAIKGATEASSKSMDEVLLLLLRAMNRIAKDHSKQPQLGLLSAKGMPQESLSNAEFGSGAWFMYHALDVSVPSALVLSSDHRKLFLSTVVELMAGNPVRQGQTHSGILFSVMRLLRDWLLDNSVDYLNQKESLVLLQRLAQVDRLHAIPTVLRQVWDKDFLDFLYTLITTKTEDNFGDDVFTKVERPFCCGLQNPDPAVRSKFFKLYSERIPRDLFERLRYIIQTQEWEFLSNTFWLKHAVALLFDCLHMEDPVTLAYNSAHVPQLFDYKESLVLHTKDKSGGGTSAENEPMDEVPKGDVEDATKDKEFSVPDATVSLLTKHLSFLREESGLRSESLVSCLIEQVQTDPIVAHHLWVLLFPIVWTSLEKEQQTGLAKPIIHLLSKEHHIRQSLLRPTVGQTLLDGISMSQPQPKIPAEMIKYMGRHFHAWHTAISMLESHVGLFPQDMRCFDAVCDLYSILGEEDMRCGLWQRRASAPETSTAMALQQHGFVPQAQSLFLEMMSRGVSGDVSGFTKSEMVLWHNQYLSCCIELNQWDVIAEYAKSVDNSALRLEAAAKLYDWTYLKTMIAPNAQVEEGPEFTLIKAQMQMSDMTLLDVDKMCKTAMSQCITRWWQMPESSPWSYASVLHSFQRTIELTESWRVMMEFSMQGGQAGHYQELKDIADTWKLRTPNEWEPVHWWSDILTWRNQVYNTTIRQFSNLQNVNPNLHQLGYRDKAWSVNRLGHVARLHHLPEACIRIINTLYGFNAMEVQEAFVKVQEQAKAYMQRPSQYIQGLNLINSTNMDYFNPNHHAEMFALKGEFLHRLNDPEAHNTFSEALTLWPLCTEGWINWGKYCDTQYTMAMQKMPQEGGDQAIDSNLQKQAFTWLEYTATCYIQAIRCSATQGISLVPRLLQLLVLDVNGKLVGKQLIQHLVDIPAWIWLPWLPQMIVGLQRPEEGTVKHVIGVSATHHPQYVYWQMRPALAHLKDVAYKAMSENEPKKDEEMPDASASGAANAAANTAGSSTPPLGGKAAGAGASTPGIQDTNGDSPAEYLAYNRAKQVMEPLRAKQATLQTLDLFITELGQRFAARTDERLLAVVHTLLHRTYRVPLPAAADIPESLCKELSSVCKACSSAASNAAGKAGGSNSWNHWNAYQMKFANDLDMNSESAPRNLGELTERLKGWRTMMEAIIEDTNPNLLRLEDVSPALMDMAVDEIMMPCQAPPSPSIPEPLYVEKMCANVHVIRRACTSSRRIAITGNDGQMKHFLITGQQNSGHGSGEERIGQLLRAANTLLDSHPESRRRDLRFAAPRSQLLYPSGRIIEDDEANCLFVDAYETYCARYGKEADAPIIKFKEIVYGDTLKDKTEEERRRQAFNEIIDPETGLVGENIFSQYMYKTMIENSKTMWTFKRQFAGSVALSSLAAFVLRLSGRTPSKLVISKASGALTHIELVTSYNDRLQLDLSNETVPFRFTRNMSTFIGQQGLEGHKISSAVAAAQALCQEDNRMSSLLALFLLPDVLAFIARRLSVRSVAAIESVTPAQVQHAVLHNVVQSVSRLERVAPSKASGQSPEPVNPTKAMRDLFAMSGAPSNLSKHPDVTWMPWY